MNKTSLILVVLVACVAVGGYFFPKVGVSFGASNTSATGTAFNTSKIASVSWAPSTDAASTTSILNTDSTDRIVRSVDISCTNLTTVNSNNIASFQVTLATTSVASQGLQGNSNFILLSTNTVATTSPDAYVATSTPGLTGVSGNAFMRRWATGSYLSFQSNASSTASCVVSASYLGS